MRSRNVDHEVDLIVERRDDRILAIEVKLIAVPHDRDVRHLHWLAQHIGSDLLDAVLITTGPYAYRRPGGMAVVPGSTAWLLTPIPPIPLNDPSSSLSGSENR